MESKMDFYKLDEIGFVGMQEKISATERRRVQKETGKIIEAYRNAMKDASDGKFVIDKSPVAES